ncbi:hypothetical protein E3U55_06090 [Filobacillus milosensis]|uniref:Uncharacterized protein n=1 Tax=Filobacillus milosensis TaxID=94137 RepID=A0A4Y8IQR4_9BACI|nr:hypothetical protein E3U55_06090 [Filobacillus milosensis]
MDNKFQEVDNKFLKVDNKLGILDNKRTKLDNKVIKVDNKTHFKFLVTPQKKKLLRVQRKSLLSKILIFHRLKG